MELTVPIILGRGEIFWKEKKNNSHFKPQDHYQTNKLSKADTAHYFTALEMPAVSLKHPLLVIILNRLLGYLDW